LLTSARGGKLLKIQKTPRSETPAPLYVACLWMCFLFIPLFFVYLCLRISTNPRSIAGAPFDSARRSWDSLLLRTTCTRSYCTWITNCVMTSQTKNQNPQGARKGEKEQTHRHTLKVYVEVDWTGLRIRIIHVCGEGGSGKKRRNGGRVIGGRGEIGQK